MLSLTDLGKYFVSADERRLSQKKFVRPKENEVFGFQTVRLCVCFAFTTKNLFPPSITLRMSLRFIRETKGKTRKTLAFQITLSPFLLKDNQSFNVCTVLAHTHSHTLTQGGLSYTTVHALVQSNRCHHQWTVWPHAVLVRVCGHICLYTHKHRAACSVISSWHWHLSLPQLSHTPWANFTHQLDSLLQLCPLVGSKQQIPASSPPASTFCFHSGNVNALALQLQEWMSS